MTGRKLELFTNIDKHLFIEKGLREGTFHIWKRFSEANNEDMKNYDLDKS